MEDTNMRMEKIAADIGTAIPQLRHLLNQTTGVYPLFIHFVEYLGTYQVWSVQPSYLSLGKRHEYLEKILFLMRKLISPVSIERASVVFITRYRPITMADGGETDYLFGSTITKLFREYSIALVSNEFCIDCRGKYDDGRVMNYNLFEFLNLGIIFKSLYFSFPLASRYIWIRRNLSDSQRIIFDRFFTFGYLFYLHVRDLCLKRMIDITRPLVIVSNDDSLDFKPMERLILFSHVILQSALINEELEWLRGNVFSHFDLEEEFLADYFLVSGTKMKEIKERLFKDAKEIVVVGQPRYDLLGVANTIYDRTKILKDLGIDPKRRILLWTTQSHALSKEEHMETVDAICTAVKGVGDVQLIVKPHPDEDRNFYDLDIITSLGDSCRIVNKYGDTYSLIYASDLVITKDSTVGIEAVALDKPIIVLNLSGAPDRVDYVKQGIAVGVYKKEDLRSAIAKLLEDDSDLKENRIIYVENYLYRIDGGASKRVADLIAELVNNTHNNLHKIDRKATKWVYTPGKEEEER